MCSRYSEYTVFNLLVFPSQEQCSSQLCWYSTLWVRYPLFLNQAIRGSRTYNWSLILLIDSFVVHTRVDITWSVITRRLTSAWYLISVQAGASTAKHSSIQIWVYITRNYGGRSVLLSCCVQTSFSFSHVPKVRKTSTCVIDFCFYRVAPKCRNV